MAAGTGEGSRRRGLIVYIIGHFLSNSNKIIPPVDATAYENRNA
jgi:hypothetical protein